MFIVIENTPGYLSEDDDPFITDNYSAAVEYMRERVASYVEHIEECDGSAEVSEGWASADNYAAVMVYDRSREHDLGRYFGVERYEEEGA
jgi:hypothetical protein